MTFAVLHQACPGDGLQAGCPESSLNS